MMVFTFIMLIMVWFLSVYAYLHVPDSIPVHFNSSSVADGFGSKSTLLFYAAGSTALVAVLWWMQRNIVSVLYTGDNRTYPVQYYIMVSRFLRTLSLSLLIFVFIVVYRTMIIALNDSAEFGLNILVSALLIIFMPSLYYIVKAISVRNHS